MTTPLRSTQSGVEQSGGPQEADPKIFLLSSLLLRFSLSPVVVVEELRADQGTRREGELKNGTVAAKRLPDAVEERNYLVLIIAIFLLSFSPPGNFSTVRSVS